MGLSERLGLSTVSRKATRSAVDEALKRLDTTGQLVLQRDDLLVHRAALGASHQALRVRKEQNADKQKAINTAKDAIRASKEGIDAANGFKKRFIDEFQGLYKSTEDKVIKPLRTQVEKGAPGSEYRLAIGDELSANYLDFANGMRGAKNLQEAKFFFDNAKTGHLKLEAKAKALAGNMEPVIQDAKNKVVSQDAYDVLARKVMALEMANAPGASDMSAKLNAVGAKISQVQYGAAMADLDKLARSVGVVADNNAKAANQALDGSRKEATRLRSLMNTYAKGSQGKFDTAKGVLVTIGNRLDVLDLFLAGNETAQSAVAATGMAKDIAAMLNEVGTMTKATDDDNKEKIKQVREELSENKLLVFSGKGALAKKYFPKEYKEIEDRREDLDTTIQGLGVSGVTLAIAELRKDAVQLNVRAETAKRQKERFDADLIEYNKTLKVLNQMIKDDKAVQKSAFKSSTFDGDFAIAVRAFSTGLQAETPDLVALAKQKSAVDMALGPVRSLDKAAVVSSHGAAKLKEKDLADRIKNAQVTVAAAETAMDDADTAVKKADPGDQLKLKMVRAEMKRTIKQVKNAGSVEALELALLGLAEAVKGASQLKESPKGDAPSRRDKLREVAANWSQAVGKVGANLTEIDEGVSAADNLDEAGKQEIKVLLAAARARFQADAFTKVVSTMTTNPSNENEPERMKAREDGLRLVRQFRDAIDKDPLITSLVVAKPFTIAGITAAHQALNDLALNLSRAV